MNKKLIALAVAGATLAPAAMAQTANPVTLYGRVFVMFENVKADGGTAAPISSRNRVNHVNGSSFGIRGTEDLGGGLKVGFQFETAFNPDSNDTTFAARNSGINLSGNFGTVLLGRWDTPFKNAGSIAFDPFGNLTIASFTSAMADRGNFDRREQNVVQYWSPNWSGFAARVSYSANEGKTATVNPVVTSFNVSYTKGPILLVAAREKHKDIFKNYTGAVGNVAGASETGQSLGGAVTFGPVRAAVVLQRYEKNGGGTTVTSDQRAQMFNLIYTAGKNQFVFQHQRSKDGATRANAAAVTAEPDTKVNSLGYYYNFSRRTSLVAVYTQVKNNRFGLGNFGAGPLAIAGDQDPRGFAIGMRHTF